MKRKQLEKIPWQSKGKRTVMVVTARAHKVDGENILLVDFSLDKPVVRIALSQNYFENYIPNDSPCQYIPQWNRRKYESFRDRRFYLPYIIYSKWKTVTDEESVGAIHQFVYGDDKYNILQTTSAT